MDKKDLDAKYYPTPGPAEYAAEDHVDNIAARLADKTENQPHNHYGSGLIRGVSMAKDESERCVWLKTGHEIVSPGPAQYSSNVAQRAVEDAVWVPKAS